MKKRQYGWGDTLRPTKEGIKSLGLKKTDVALFISNRRDGQISVLRWGYKTIEVYYPRFWESNVK